METGCHASLEEEMPESGRGTKPSLATSARMGLHLGFSPKTQTLKSSEKQREITNKKG